MSSRGLLFTSACAGIFMFGIVIALLGTMFGLPAVRARYDLGLGEQGNVFLALYFGLFVSTTVAGPTLDRFGAKIVLVVSTALVTAALVGFILADSAASAGAAAVLLGLGGGGLNTSVNVLVSTMYDEQRAARLNLLGIFFGIGALVVPLVGATLTATFSIEQLLAAAAALAGACMMTYMLLRFPVAREAGGFALGDALSVIKHPGVLLFAVMLFFQSGNEASIAGWTSTYAGERGWGARAATWVLAGYWAALIAGRMTAAQLLRSVPQRTVLIASGAGAIAGCVVLLGAATLPLVAAGAILIGFSFGPVYPTALAMAGDRYQRFAGTVFGILFSIALIGGMTSPWAVGHLAELLGIRLSMLVPLLGAVMVTVLATRVRAAGGGKGDSGGDNDDN
jgi:FHS family glucose/mannose:H+ symporter-like MFS transporter